MGDTAVILKKGKGRTVKSGGMWIFDNQMINVRLGEFNEDMTALKGTILMNYEV